jgi:hypothetical protein
MSEPAPSLLLSVRALSALARDHDILICGRSDPVC